MAKPYKHEEQELDVLRPIYPSAQIYYTDFNCEQRKTKFTITQTDWNIIRCDNDPSKLLSANAKILMGNIENMINRDLSGKAYLSYEAIEDIIICKKWQIIQLRKQFAHIFHSKWRKSIKINGIVRHNVVVFQYTCNGKDILNNPYKYYKNVKACGYTNASIYKDENIKKYRSNESKSYKNSNLEKNASLSSTFIVNNNDEGKVNKLNAEERGFRNSRESNHPSKNLRQMITTLDQTTCDEIRSKSERPDFTDNFIRQTVLKLAKKTTIKASFYSIKGFIAYMSKVMRYELHDGVKCSSEHFRFKVNIDEERLEYEKNQKVQKDNMILFTTYQQRENYLNQIEDNAIRHRSDENQYKARIAAQMPPNLAYNLLMNLINIREENNTLKLIMIKDIGLTEYYKKILIELAIGIGGYSEIKKLEICI